MTSAVPATPKAPRKPRAKKPAVAKTTIAAVEETVAPVAAAPEVVTAAVAASPVVVASPVVAAPVVAEVAEAAKAPALSTEERIRLAAYLRYEARGFTPGDSLQDWVEAEREVGQAQTA